MNKLCLSLTLVTFSLIGTYTDAEKIILIQEKLTFLNQQMNALERINNEHKAIYKQAQDVAEYALQETYSTTKQQIKNAVQQILATQEFINYYNYSIMLKTPLIGKYNIKAKNIPVIRPNHAFSSKINDILSSTVPVKLLHQIEVLTLFETLLNFKIDAIEIQGIINKLELFEKELIAMLKQLESNETN